MTSGRGNSPHIIKDNEDRNDRDCRICRGIDGIETTIRKGMQINS